MSWVVFFSKHVFQKVVNIFSFIGFTLLIVALWLVVRVLLIVIVRLRWVAGWWRWRRVVVLRSSSIISV